MFGKESKASEKASFKRETRRAGNYEFYLLSLQIQVLNKERFPKGNEMPVLQQDKVDARQEVQGRE